MRGSRQRRRRRLLLYLTKRRRRRRMAMAATVMVFAGLIAYAGSLLWSSAHDATELTKELYIAVKLSGSSAKGSVKPGRSISLAPVISNDGSIPCAAFMKLTIPKVNGSPAYSYKTKSNWTQAYSSSEGNYYIDVYAYGTQDSLEAIEPGIATSSLVDNGFTMINMSGAEFRGMTDVNIQVDGYLVDYAEVEKFDPESAWGMIPQ